MVRTVRRKIEEALGWVTTQTRVLFADTDAMGIVYYGNYLRFFEIGRNEYFRAAGASYAEIEKSGVRLVVIEVAASYRASACYDDEINIETGLAVIGAARLRFCHRLTRVSDGKLLVEGFTDNGCISTTTGRPVRLPPIILNHTRPRK